MKQISFSPKSAQRGVVLIEAMVAILLFSIGVLAVAGLQATMLQNVGDSKYRADASYIAQQRLGDMYTHMQETLNLQYNVADEPVALPKGTISVSQAVPRGPFLIEVKWTQPGDTEEHKYAVLAVVAPDCYPGDPGC
ncbi:MAG: prepilin-type cleavage/methylation domain-containing protein [Gammaproteobacteria bacterium]|nr:prepilin-type cleavage/methylation domain-containing protein [Gammaproteobacteria bacterium]MBU1482548.1 prepilin-type cleavage/methylation domain-containing protein [Gammaproteobacteria bacterium]